MLNEEGQTQNAKKKIRGKYVVFLSAQNYPRNKEEKELIAKNVTPIISLNGSSPSLPPSFSNFCDGQPARRPLRRRPAMSASSASVDLGQTRSLWTLLATSQPRCHRRRSFRASKKAAAAVPHPSLPLLTL